MVDTLGTSTIKASDLRVASVLRPVAATSVAGSGPVSAPVAPAAPVAAAASATLARSMASEPPVDLNRVQQIKTAIANGTFPLSPSTIADQFIALKYDWISNEQA